MTEPNDIPAILARVNAWTHNELPRSAAYNNAVELIETDVPNMAAEILSLRADNERLTGLVRFVSDFSGAATPTSHPDTRIGINLAEESLAQKRLDVLEELIASGGSIGATAKYVLTKRVGSDGAFHRSLTEAADAELLSRREKENG